MDELKDIVALLKLPDFDPADIDTDLHKRVADAIKDGFIKRFDMRVNSRDEDQDLSMWMRDVEEVVREIMRDECFKGHQNFSFEACLQDDGQRVFGGEANAGSHFRLVKSGEVLTSPELSQDISSYP